MTLPFQPFDKRQYVCFICGLAHDSFTEYTQHIIDNHEEGREYIRCPLARCQACVRDIRAHFHAKHKSEKIPKNCQMKALIWSDHRSPKKKKRPKFKEGWVDSAKNGKKMHYRSGYEKEVYECLERWDEVAGYAVEKFRVEYYFNGKPKGYYPDLLIKFHDGHCEVWEIKPSNQTNYAINKAKWDACSLYCQARGWLFEVYTETRISQLKKKVIT